ncbi:transposase [Candidatus Peregrinibacteria bacterium]|nr:transposase [Candidatus Peregrinibacteria bacterium]
MAASSLIDNTIRNTLRNITKECTLPQKKGVKELLLSLMREGTTVVNHLADTEKKVRVGKQAERYRRHLETIDLSVAIEERIGRTLPRVKENTVIAYDLSDIAKPHAKKMEGMARIFDGSERSGSKGYIFHGVSIFNQPVIMQLHDSNAKTLNQTRLKVIERVQKQTETRGIWVFDRGNDDQQFFAALKARDLRFVVRLRSNRHFIEKETGEIKACDAFVPGTYQVLLPKSREEYTLVVHQYHPVLQPIRVLTNVAGKGAKEIIETYLERWDVENLFKQMKLKYNLEAIRLLSLKKIKNLIALVQMVVSLNNSIFEQVEKEKQGALSLSFSSFCYYRSLSRNRFSFTDFIATITPEINTPVFRSPQPALFSWRQLGKLGVF